MGRIFISAGHGGYEDGRIDTGAVVTGTTEAREMILLRDLIVTELRSRNIEVLAVPDDLSQRQTMEWINARSRDQDVALEIQADAYTNPTVRGVAIYYITNNEDRRGHADLMLLALLRRVPQLASRGAKSDTTTVTGRVPFCRDLVLPSMLLEVVALSNPDDRALLQARRREFALGIADGLAAWSRSVAGGTVTPTPTPGTPGTPAPTPLPPGTYAPVNLTVNSQPYAEPGILINGNAYVPIDLVDRLGIKASDLTPIRRVSYSGVVYIKAIELRDYNIAIAWDNATRTVNLRSILKVCPGFLDQVMGHGYTSEVQLMVFLKSHNEGALVQFPDLPKLYREESIIEGVNYDLAFCQMCLETSFLRFGNDVKPEQNNFAGLGAVGGGAQGASFPSPRLGVRAQIQHLKAYASTEPLVQELVDPRFRFVSRGIAPLVHQLNGRWAADLQYGEKIMALLRRLYESAGLL